MELTLNVIWLMVSLAILAVWGWWTWRYASKRKQHRLFEVLALLGIALVLFPNISMSDDILGDLWIWIKDDKISLLSAVGIGALHGDHLPLAVCLLLLAICVSGISFFLENGRWWKFFVEAEDHFYLSLQNARPLRAPPVFSPLHSC